MNAAAAIDGTRLIRIATAGLAILAGALVYFRSESEIAALTLRLDDARTELRSDDIVFAEVDRLRGARDALKERYARALRHGGEARLLRDVEMTARRYGISVLSTVAASDASATNPPAGATDVFTHVDITLELRGAYRSLLAATVDLSRGNEIVRVSPPSFRRAGGALVASIPISVYDVAPIMDDNDAAGGGPP